MQQSSELKLSSIPGAWRLFISRKFDPNFGKFALRVFKRDGYICRFCGFQARRFQEVINLDRNYQNNKLSNFATCCCFCAQCFFLEAVGKGDYGGGVLIYLPTISQAELNGLCHVLFCAIVNATDYRIDAQTIYRTLKLRAKLVEEHLGEGMTNPRLIGEALVQSATDFRTFTAPPWLASLRLLPSRIKFAKQISVWAKDALEEVSK